MLRVSGATGNLEKIYLYYLKSASIEGAGALAG